MFRVCFSCFVIGIPSSNDVIRHLEFLDLEFVSTKLTPVTVSYFHINPLRTSAFFIS